MTPFKKLISILTAAAMVICVAAASFANASAVVTVSDGTYEYSYYNNGWLLYSYSGTETDITLPESFGGYPVWGIYDECFSQTSVTSVTIPEGYESIGSYAFYGCEGLREVSFPSTLKSVGMGAFSGSGLQSADLSRTNLDLIPAYCFKNCSSLASADLPGSVNTIGLEAFYGTGSLENVKLRRGITSIGDSCFENSALGSINLPEGLESIGNSAFRNASQLSELYIPESVSSIGVYALYPMSIQKKINAYCKEGSYADEYCYENFVYNTYTFTFGYGDADSSGYVSISDVTFLQRYQAQMIEIDDPCVLKLSDVNLDGAVDINDATEIQRYVAKFYDYLPVE